MVAKWGISGIDSSCSRVAQCRENLSLALEILGWAQWLHQGSQESLGILMEGGLLRLNCTGKLGVTGICYIVCEVVICPFSLSFQGTRFLPLWDGKYWTKWGQSNSFSASHFNVCFGSIEGMKCLSMQKFWEECVGRTDTIDTRGINLPLGSPEAKRQCDSTNIITKNVLAGSIQITEDAFCVLNQCLDQRCEQGEVPWIVVWNYYCQ